MKGLATSTATASYFIPHLLIIIAGDRRMLKEIQCSPKIKRGYFDYNVGHEKFPWTNR